MAELSYIHRYAAGGLLALALTQAQMQQYSLPSGLGVTLDIDPDDAHFTSSFTLENEIPWTSMERYLLRHVFRCLRIEEKAWVGLEVMSVSQDAKHHIGSFLRMLSEEENELSSCDQTEVASTEDVDAVSTSYGTSTNGHLSSTVGHLFWKSMGMERSHCESSSPNDGEDSRLVEVRLKTKQRKMAVLHELLAACVTDFPEENAESSVLSVGYDARQRVAIRLLALWLDISWRKVAGMEIMVAYMALDAQERAQTQADDNEAARRKWRNLKRGGVIGAAAVTGGTLLAITGGLAAPALAAAMATIGTAVPALGAGGLATVAALTGTTMGSVAVAASFGAAGAGLTGYKMARRIGGVEEFLFVPIGENHQQGRLAVAIMVSGIAFKRQDFIHPWEGPDGDLERYALCWESKHVIAVSTAIQDWLASSVAKEMMKRGAMLTVLSSLLTALAWPATLLGATDFIDSKWTLALNRSDKAGKVLADVLLKGGQGSRPVTLIGFSLGARVVFACLEELAKRGDTGGIVERVVLLGAPLVLNTRQWQTVRKVVAGRFINGYSTNDWMLGVIYRATFLTQGLAGLQAVNIPGIENVDVTEIVKGHSSYLSKVGDILQAIDIDSFYPTHPSKIQRRKL
ncbi:hypothetical protein BDL97_18G045000 [Sphagnum fallax]|nr:hypothetical protein BDL97_18G045000 [Sphagnum fallax]